MLELRERSSIEKTMYSTPPYCASVETFELSDELDGLTLQTLRPCDRIHVRTCNSDYDIFLIEPESGRALVRGGKFFTQPVEATISGSTFGGSMLRVGWLCEGLQMEFNANGRSIVTSPVQEMRVERGILNTVVCAVV
jgi:hypothetical protein